MSEKLVLLEKTYHGFEDAYDYFRDVSEIFDFPEDEDFKKVKDEFKGKLKVVVEFYPEEGDLTKENVESE